SNPYHAKDGERRGGTVGFPLPGVQLRVCDDQGREVPAGEIGGIQVKGPNVFKGYWRMPEKTKEEFTDDGWFRTGDVGKVDERCFVVQELPRNTMGKVQKNLLREQHKALFA